LIESSFANKENKSASGHEERKRIEIFVSLSVCLFGRVLDSWLYDETRSILWSKSLLIKYFHGSSSSRLCFFSFY